MVRDRNMTSKSQNHLASFSFQVYVLEQFDPGLEYEPRKNFLWRITSLLFSAKIKPLTLFTVTIMKTKFDPATKLA